MGSAVSCQCGPSGDYDTVVTEIALTTETTRTSPIPAHRFLTRPVHVGITAHLTGIVVETLNMNTMSLLRLRDTSSSCRLDGKVVIPDFRAFEMGHPWFSNCGYSQQHQRLIK